MSLAFVLAFLLSILGEVVTFLVVELLILLEETCGLFLLLRSVNLWLTVSSYILACHN